MTFEWRVASHHTIRQWLGERWKIALRGEVGRCPDCAGRLRLFKKAFRYSKVRKVPQSGHLNPLVAATEAARGMALLTPKLTRFLAAKTHLPSQLSAYDTQSASPPERAVTVAAGL